MRVKRISYARVAQNAAPPAAKIQPHDGLEKFLLDHLDAMLDLAAKDKSPYATFTDPAAAALFEQLRTGSRAEFLTASEQLTRRLIGRMDGRTKPGLLLCMTIDDGDGAALAAALKLQVVAPNAAILDRLESGEEVLVAVDDLVDTPGELQKGAVVADPRDGSDVIVGDKLDEGTRYFPEAFDIRQEAKPRDAAVNLLEAVIDQDRTTGERVADVLPTVPAGRLDDVLEDLGEKVPSFTPDLRRDVAAALKERRRPVVRVDTSVPIKQVVTADGITIEGPEPAMRRVVWEPRQDGGYRITIDVTQPPQRRMKR